MRKKIPQFLQSVLWSVKINNLDLEKDKVFIINQVLAFGGWEEIRWLFKVYPKRTTKKVFLEQPIKTYRPPTFNFVKRIILGLRKENLIEEKYVINPPRILNKKRNKECLENRNESVEMRQDSSVG